MTKFMIPLCCLLVLAVVGAAWAGEPAPAKIKALADARLCAVGVDPVVVAAVKAANAEGKTLDQIKAQDEQWRNTPGIAGYMRDLMDNDCAKLLRKLQDDQPYVAEAFVMDNQGANVAMTDKTSDYWQGDEAKWQQSYKNGEGAVHIGDVEFDDSAQAYVVQISVPVKDGDQVVGAITFGVDVDQVK